MHDDEPEVVGAPEATRDTPTEDAPSEEGHAPEAIDYEKRYNDLRPEFDRTTQELAQLREFRESLADPSRQADVLRDFGIELADDEPGEEDADDVFRDPRVDQLIAEREQERAAAQQQQAYEGFVVDTMEQVDALERELGEEFSDDEVDLLLDLREAAARRGQDVAIKDVYQNRLNQVFETRRQKYVQSKRAPQASKVGQAAADDGNRLDVDDRPERVRRMTERLRMSGE